jgi:Arc/MetJ family transcription regulator
MGSVVLKRTNLLLEEGKVNELRRRLRARSNSEAVRIAIDRELAAKEALAALRSLRERGTLKDVFHRLRSDQK